MATSTTNNLEWLPQRTAGGSRYGFHFLSDLKCETYFYHRNLRPHPEGGLGIQPASYRAPLDIGSRVHKGLEAWYWSGWSDGGAEDKGMRSLDAAVKAHRGDHDRDSSDELLDSIAMTDRLLRLYDERYGSGPYIDWPHNKVLVIDGKPAIEHELSIDVGYRGYVFTARLDLIWLYGGEYLYSLEHKTTGARQRNGLIQRIELDGQFTGQVMLLQHHFGEQYPVGGVTLDYIVKDSGKDKPALGRVNTSRTPEQLEKFRLDMARRLDHIEQLVGQYRELLSKDIPPDDAARLTFDGSPDGYQCVGAFGKCDFYDLCANRRQADELVKLNYKPREYVGHENPFSGAK